MKPKKIDYELIDSGKFRRLESFGGIIIDRPCPQAHWPQNKKIDWTQSMATFIRPEKGAGFWKFKQKLPENWTVSISDIKVEARFSTQGQVGIFPEQWTNWIWANNLIKKSKKPLKILNLFGYTGIASLMASYAGAEEVCHVDGAKSSINWAKTNQKISGLQTYKIRWIIDDVLKFLEREVRRGNRYEGIILDPPAFGRGKGKTDWRIERDLFTCMTLIDQLLSPQARFVILTCHAPTLERQDLAYYLEDLAVFKGRKAETMELKIKSEKGNDLPSSFGARILR